MAMEPAAPPEQDRAAAPAPELKGRKKRFPVFRLLLLLVVLAAAGCLGWLFLRRKGSPMRINVSDGGTYAVNFTFFEKYMSPVDGGLFFSGACKSNADGGIMASTILGKGFDAYVGADGNINQLYSNEVLSETARNLAKLDIIVSDESGASPGRRRSSM